MRRRSGGGKFAILIVIAVIYFIARRERDSSPSESSADAPAASSAIDRALTPETTPAERDGLAAAILIDVSGSMKQEAGGSGPAKIVSARRAALDLVDQFARYADEHKGEPVLLGLYEFSQRSGEPDCREVIAMGPPNRARAAGAVAAMIADGGTPIGNAMITGKRALDATGLSRRHLLVVTDGENTNGPEPETVAAAITRRPATERPSLYFVAFDISANRFDGVRNAGGLVLEAANARALNDTLDALLRGKILIER
jgi:hypothetical protein